MTPTDYTADLLRHIDALAAERDALRSQLTAPENLLGYYAKQIEWSRETFGPGLRTKGIIQHITKELREIEAEPHDLSEWVDVAILAMDGFWRHGGKAEDLLPALLAKQAKNMVRDWPDWRTMSEDTAIEHHRTSEPSAVQPAPIRAETHDDALALGVEIGMDVAARKPAPDVAGLVAAAAKDAREVFSGTCSTAKESVDYMEQLIYAAIAKLEGRA